MKCRALSRSLTVLALSAALFSLGLHDVAHAESGSGTPSDQAPPKEPPKVPRKEPVAEAPKVDKKLEAKVTCTLLTTEAPRGGRLEVEGKNFGKSPVVKINAETTRTIERSGDRIAVQIPRKSEGGAVTIRAEGQDVHCGMLVIIGTDR